LQRRPRLQPPRLLLHQRASQLQLRPASQLRLQPASRLQLRPGSQLRPRRASRLRLQAASRRRLRPAGQPRRSCRRLRGRPGPHPPPNRRRRGAPPPPPHPTPPSPTATATVIPGPPKIGGTASTIFVGGSFTIAGTGFTAGSVVNFFVATSAGPVNVGPFTP